MNDPAFFQALSDFSQVIDDEVKQWVQGIVHDVFVLILDGNPLDTGRCTASWTASLDQPVYRDATDVTPQSKLGREAAKARSLITLQALDAFTLGDIIYLSNGTDYVSKLEEDISYVKTTNGYGHFVSLAKAAYEGNGIRMMIHIL